MKNRHRSLFILISMCLLLLSVSVTSAQDRTTLVV
jgi:hypothetical protein